MFKNPLVLINLFLFLLKLYINVNIIKVMEGHIMPF